MSDLIGRTLGQYLIVEQIGQGGMATVYKAYQPSLNRYVALKVLSPIHAQEAGFSERFRREAEAVANLNHPNILPVFDFGQEQGYSFIAMRYVAEARTLKEVMADPLTLAQVADLIGQIAAALDYAHRQSVVHRDVKPSNVLMDGNWALLGDFGLAKMTEASVKLTGSGVSVGTPAYMSPEQGQGLEVDHRTDIYSLGIVLFEMLTGQIPHSAETPLAIVFKRMIEPLPLPRSINPDIPEGVERVILKALARDPRGRFARAGAMAEALNQAVSELEVIQEEDPALIRPGTEADGPSASEQAAGARSRGEVESLPAPGGVPSAVPIETPALTMPEAEQAPVRRAFPWKWVAGLGAVGVVVAMVLAGLGSGMVRIGRPTLTSEAMAGAPTVPPAARRPTHTPAPTPTGTLPPMPTDSPQPGDAVKVALLFPMTGPVAALGQSSQEGAELAIVEWNERGGLLGRDIEWMLADTGCDGAMATEAAREIIDQHNVKLIVGGACSIASIPISEIANPKKVLQISHVSTDPQVTLGKPYTFRACFLDPFQGEVMAAFAIDDLGASTAAVMYDEGNPYARGMAEYFQQAFEARGGQVLVHEAYVDADTDFAPVLSQVADAHPDVLLLPSFYHSVGLIGRQAKEMAIAATLLGGDGWDSTDLDRDAVDGGYHSSHYSPADPRPVVQGFMDRYEAEYDKVPDALAALAYDATNVLLAAIQRAGTDDPKTVRDTLAGIEFEGVSGVLSFDAEGDAIKMAVINRIVGGEVEFVKFVAPYRQ